MIKPPCQYLDANKNKNITAENKVFRAFLSLSSKLNLKDF